MTTAALPIAANNNGTAQISEASRVAAASKSAASPIEKVIQAGRQVYDPIVDEKTGESFDPILAGHTNKMRGNIQTVIAPALLKCYGPGGSGKAHVKDVWNALRTGMKSEDLLITDMTPEALKDLFGGEQVSLDDVVAALINFRTLLASRKFDFNRYRKATEFYSMPEGFYEMVKNNPVIENHLRETRQTFSSSGGLYKNLQNLKALNMQPGALNKHFERIALTLAWAEFIEHCDYNDLDLKGLDLRDELIAARIAKMFIDQTKGKTDLKAKKDELELLRDLSKASIGKALISKYEAALREKKIKETTTPLTLRGMGIDFTKDAVWSRFLKVQASLNTMGSHLVANLLDELKKLSPDLKINPSQKAPPDAIPVSR